MPNLHSRIVPPIKTMANVAAVAESDALLQYSGARAQSQFHHPFHAIDSVDVAYGRRGAAVRMFRERVVHRRHRDPIVGNRKIELNAKGRPRTSITDSSFPDRRIRVEHRLPADFVDAGVKMAAHIRKHGTFQVLIFEIDGTPLVFRARVGDFVSKSIGIVEAASRELIKRRIRVRRSLLVGRELQDAFPHAHLPASRYRENQQEKESRGPAPGSHPGERISRARIYDHLSLSIYLFDFPFLRGALPSRSKGCFMKEACKGNFSTTRLIIPSSEGESGRRPSSRQRKKAKSWATTT